MIANTPEQISKSHPGKPGHSPISGMSSKAHHVAGTQNSSLNQSRHILSAFALTLCLALVTVFCMLVTSMPLNAMQIAQPASMPVPTNSTGGLVALTAILSLAASAGVGITLVKLQFSPNRKR